MFSCFTSLTCLPAHNHRRVRCSRRLFAFFVDHGAWMWLQTSSRIFGGSAEHLSCERRAVKANERRETVQLKVEGSRLRAGAPVRQRSAPCGPSRSAHPPTASAKRTRATASRCAASTSGLQGGRGRPSAPAGRRRPTRRRPRWRRRWRRRAGSRRRSRRRSGCSSTSTCARGAADPGGRGQAVRLWLGVLAVQRYVVEPDSYSSPFSEELTPKCVRTPAGEILDGHARICDELADGEHVIVDVGDGTPLSLVESRPFGEVLYQPEVNPEHEEVIEWEQHAENKRQSMRYSRIKVAARLSFDEWRAGIRRPPRRSSGRSSWRSGTPCASTTSPAPALARRGAGDAVAPLRAPHLHLRHVRLARNSAQFGAIPQACPSLRSYASRGSTDGNIHNMSLTEFWSFSDYSRNSAQLAFRRPPSPLRRARSRRARSTARRSTSSSSRSTRSTRTRRTTRAARSPSVSSSRASSASRSSASRRR